MILNSNKIETPYIIFGSNHNKAYSPKHSTQTFNFVISCNTQQIVTKLLNLIYYVRYMYYVLKNDKDKSFCKRIFNKHFFEYCFFLKEQFNVRHRSLCLG